MGAVLGLVPGLPVLAIALLLYDLAAVTTPESLAPLLIGFAVGHASVGALPAIILHAPDDTTVLLASAAPYDAHTRRDLGSVVLFGVGVLGGAVLLLVLGWRSSAYILPLQALIRPHLYWVIALLGLCALGGGAEGGGVRTSLVATVASLASFWLSGLLGLLLVYRPSVTGVSLPFTFAPAIVGLFIVPNLLAGIFSAEADDRRSATFPTGVRLRPLDVGAGVGIGVASGLVGGLFPFLGAVGNAAVDIALGPRLPSMKMIAHGAARLAYAAGVVFSLMLARGRATDASPPADVLPSEALGAMAVSAALAFLLLPPASRALARLTCIARASRRAGMLLAMALIGVGILAGGQGLAVCTVGALIGGVPLAWGGRRESGLGLILLPAFLNLIGWGGALAHALGLLR